jgi:ABC-type Fe3+/spermidine/putrescine transport system ATPase subunit
VSSGARLRLEHVAFSYAPPVRVVDDFSLDAEPGEMVALLGASGCGKTTILRLIAGLLRPDRGTIEVDGAVLNGIPAEKRRTAMVFQKPLLFPHLSVGENIGFSLKLKNSAANDVRERVREALALVKLEGFEARRPNRLSGGQEQRVSLARALVSDPRILLLDEPFAALDENLRAEMRSLVRGIQRRLQLTSIFVTHDRNEAAAMAHRIAFLDRGHIVQTGSLRQFYETPASVEAARFFGWQLLRGQVERGQAITALGCFPAADASGPLWICIRPNDLVIGADTASTGVIVESSVDLGDRVATVVRTSGDDLLEVVHGPPEIPVGQAVRVTLDASAVRIFPRIE